MSPNPNLLLTWACRSCGTLHTIEGIASSDDEGHVLCNDCTEKGKPCQICES